MTTPNFGTLSVASFWLEYLLDAALHHGVDLSAELVRLGVTDDQLESPQARVPLRVEHQLLLKALRETNDPLFGLHMGERIRPRFMGELGYASMSGSNLRQAIDLMVPFQRVTTEFAEAEVLRDGDHVTLLWHTAFDEPVTTRHRVEAFLSAPSPSAAGSVAPMKIPWKYASVTPCRSAAQKNTSAYSVAR